MAEGLGPHWLYEEGIGETRAALVAEAGIVELAIEREGTGSRAGAVIPARLEARLPGGTRGRLLLEGGETAILRSIPPMLTDGARLTVRIVREAIVGGVDPKPAQAVSAEAGAIVAQGPSLLQRIAATGHPVRHLAPTGPDLLEEVGWSEALEAAQSGLIVFPDGLLRIWLTPAMTLIDVDGSIAPQALAIAGARAAGTAIRRLDIGGSIGIDLPTIAGKADRQAAAAALDAVLPQPFERTAVNGFGFLQIVRRRERMSIMEHVQGDRVATAALALLRAAERSPGAGERTIAAHRAVIDHLAARPAWSEALGRRIGAPVVLRVAPGLAISSGHVQAHHT